MIARPRRKFTRRSYGFTVPLRCAATVSPPSPERTVMKNRPISNSNMLLWLSTAAALSVSAPAIAAEIQVPLDHVRTVTFERPAKTIYIGNPTVADITVVDSRHVFVLGKSFGSTNLIALDSAGEETVNEQVIVTDRPGGVVTIQRGVARMNMICTASLCEGSPVPGDDATSDKSQKLMQPPHDGIIDQADKREQIGQKNAASSSK